VNWYFTTLLFNRNSESRVQQSAAQRCHYLITADDHDRAYEKSMLLGNSASKQHFRFAGLSDLLLVYDPPDESTELLWSQIEVAPAELENEIRQKERMLAFQTERSSPSGWYVGGIVLYEVHDEGSHGEKLLVWINSYLIKAKEAEIAYQKAVQIGTEQEDEPGSHTCGGEKAHWRFKGVRNIIPVRDVPADTALLWCEDIKSSELGRMVPKKSELSVFAWQAEQVRHGAVK
jgi:hypothetical protein